MKLIDVSEHNGRVDWNRVKQSGYHAIIRCGYGTKTDDKQFLNNMRGAEAAGVPYGLYLYSYANSESQAKGEADHLLRCARECRGIGYPLYIDLEESRYAASAALVASVVCSAVERAGYYAGVYASESWWQTHLKGVTKYSRWVAKWSKTPPKQPWQMWQYSATGNVAGLSPVDCNETPIDFPKIIRGKFDGGTQTQTPATPAQSPDALADAVLRGEYGNGSERKRRLGDRYDVVQAIVDKRLTGKPNLDKVVSQTMAGLYGNGDVRRSNLGSIYDLVQSEINKRYSK